MWERKDREMKDQSGVRERVEGAQERASERND